jgi:hypothetical protein
VWVYDLFGVLGVRFAGLGFLWVLGFSHEGLLWASFGFSVYASYVFRGTRSVLSHQLFFKIQIQIFKILWRSQPSALM